MDSSKDKLAKSFHRELEGWREVLVGLYSLLVWDKPYYPAIISGVTSFVFLLIWYLDPSILTLIALTGLIITLTDYLVPQLSALVNSSNSWSGEQERQYQQVIEFLACAAGGLGQATKSVAAFKVNRPKVYFICVTCSLAFLAWLGSHFSNLFLTYCFVLFGLMVPGLRKQGVLQRQLSMVIKSVAGAVGTKQQGNTTTKNGKQN